MTEPTTREAIVQALFALMDDSDFFPNSTADADGNAALQLDAPEPTGWRTLTGDDQGLEDCAALQDDGEPETTAEVLGADDDPDLLSSELSLSPTIAYAVAGLDRNARRARCDAGIQEIERLVALDRTLGVDAQVYARVAACSKQDAAPVPHGKPVALALVTLEIDYVAASPAG